ncbi:hypothetical protein FJV76_13695 [Mesorhizobium sp. WSM4303]|uniref:hypothetical protein n=1 Tax=unclassified Mesorhizobium TaxID=325217 RepID=UPI00115E8882|nr:MULTISPECIES: hypothetical protein [unclassified Mesorhizobium]TRC98352.1 hypothetical protein FJV77_07805 [Mesorhizobium sp. WSM4306]TRD04329.1 hypothetical protein FJV76_13695 [Mesorhizobium sp. WSM4303]
MSDEPSRLAEGMTAVPREGRRVENHACEHPGCGKDAGFGFARPRQAFALVLFLHRGDGERFL